RFKWITLVRVAVYRIRRKEKFHALDVPRRGPVSLVHVTATNPLGSRCHSDLVPSAVIANHCAYGVGSVSIIIARLRRIVSARIANTVVNRVMPVVIVIGVLSVPTTIMRLERVVRPTLARI